MRLRLLLTVSFTMSLLTAGYVAIPFWTAWSIREAVKAGDSAYLARKIDFASVRETLRPSLAEVALDIPNPDAPNPDAGEGDGAQRPGLWNRIKASWGRNAIDTFVDSYVTPEGLPKMFQWRKSYREATGSVAAEPPSLRNRLASFWSRLKRAEFISPTAFEIEMRDQYDARRSHVGLLELTGFEWKLTKLRLQQAASETNEPLPGDK